MAAPEQTVSAQPSFASLPRSLVDLLHDYFCGLFECRRIPPKPASVLDLAATAGLYVSRHLVLVGGSFRPSIGCIVSPPSCAATIKLCGLLIVCSNDKTLCIVDREGHARVFSIVIVLVSDRYDEVRKGLPTL